MKKAEKVAEKMLRTRTIREMRAFMMKKENIVLPYLYAFITMLSLYSLDIIWGQNIENPMFKKVGIEALIIYIGISYLYRNKFKRYKNWNYRVVVMASFFSFSMLIGRSFESFNSLDFLFYDTVQFLYTVLLFSGYFFLFYVCINEILEFIKKPSLTFVKKIRWSNYILFLLICWLPYIIVFFPGSVPHDGMYQLNMFFGFDAINNNHPVLSTALMGVAMKIGKLTGSDNMGIFLYILCQSVVSAAIISYMIIFMQKIKAPVWLVMITILYFSFFPLWPAYMQAEVKDTIFISIMIIYQIIFLKILKNDSFLAVKKNQIIFTLIMMFMCLIRNNGLHVVILCNIALMLSYKSRAQKTKVLNNLLKSTSICVITVLIINNCIYPALNIESGSIKEALSVPFQQTARYVKEYPEKVTEEEKQVINSVLDYDSMAEQYDPLVSDPVKNKYHGSSDSLANYFMIWIKMFFKEPQVYIKAIINNTYAYFYPDERIEPLGIFQFYMKQEINGGFKINYIKDFETIRTKFINFSYFWRDVPILNLLYSTGFYTWIFILLLLILWDYKKYTEIIGLFPGLVTILICVASPVNGYVRYMLPVMAITPLIIAWTLYAIREPII